MNFNLNEETQMVRDLARGILEKEVDADRVAAIGKQDEWFDRPLWKTLAEAGLLGLAVDEELGGMGFGITEICVLLEEIGRVVAPVPVLPALVLGGLPIARYGTTEQKQRWLPPLVSGQAFATAALVDAESGSGNPPATVARPDGDAWMVSGTKVNVPAVDTAAAVLIAASTETGAGLFFVEPDAEGMTVTRHGTTLGEPMFTLELNDVRVAADARLGGADADDPAMLDVVYEHALVAICATQVGVSDVALHMTCDYVREREQFGVPIGSFQAVQHRAADAYIDLASMRWTTWRAVWKMAEGLPASRELMVAKFWAAEAGARIAASAQHLHAGIGVDMDYPVHRYTLWSKALELSLGGTASQLVRLGRDMAATGPQEEI